MNHTVQKIIEDAERVKRDSSEEEKFEIMKRILLSQRENPMTESTYSYGHLTNIATTLYGSPNHETRHEINTKMHNGDVLIIYWIGFGYGPNLNGVHEFNVYTIEGSVSTSANNASKSGIELYKPKTSGYHASVKIHNEAKNKAYLCVPNPRNISDILLSSKNYEDFMKNLVEQDIRFPFA